MKQSQAHFSARSLIGFLTAALVSGLLGATAASSQPAAEDAQVILPGDSRLNTPPFDDFEAVYTSSSSKTGGFTLQARKTGDGKRLTLVDIIPMKDNVIVAHRNIDLATHRFESSAGPYFAWGAEIVVQQASPTAYDWSRIPIGGGEPKRVAGEMAGGGTFDDMFTPTLASLMPMAPGTKFRLPVAYPRKSEIVSSEFDMYQVLRREHLELPLGLSCNCWVIEKRAWGSEYKSRELIWVSREAPFVFRRHRDVGGQRDFVSEVLSFRRLEN